MSTFYLLAFFHSWSLVSFAKLFTLFLDLNQTSYLEQICLLVTMFG